MSHTAFVRSRARERRDDAAAARLSRQLRRSSMLAALLLAFSLTAATTEAQSGLTLYGDLRIEEKKGDDLKPLSFDIILYFLDGRVVGRQKISNGGRYRFLNVRPNEYDLVLELDNQEVARMRISVGAAGPGGDFRRDIELEWKERPSSGAPARKQTVSAADFYQRTQANQSIFVKAQEAMDQKKHDQAVALLRQIVEADAQDFQAWTELGTAYLLQKKHGDAEKAYLRAIEVRPAFALAPLNLGRLLALQKNYDAAIPQLTRAVELQPENAEANLLLGEAYLQIKKGSKAVGYLNTAARLGRSEAHLLLATLYHAAGFKDKAAAEYEQFLVKEPNHHDKKKFQSYISENKKK
ncbi:MAG TPA: tetratricopeptide repeat protein [Pyrinomonadaceae bacterium]|jgi:tetratricopeptide (TPR) repeat protein|nr:tetratricopeptide repeat protein [Pyrinomonadaceae bacterium]